MSGIALLSFSIAWFYYQGVNKAADPRVVDTRYMLSRYDALMSEKKYPETLPLLDSIDAIFRSVSGYGASFERGIVFNNRGSAFLSMALYQETDSVLKSQMLVRAKENFDSSILIYQNWLDKFGSLSRNGLSEEAVKYFKPGDSAFHGLSYNRILEKRVDELQLAQKENVRRLSVAYTNLGIAQRHQLQQDSAMKSYIRAIELWKDNYTARNNFNVLMGLDPEDRSVIEKLFPPDKNK